MRPRIALMNVVVALALLLGVRPAQAGFIVHVDGTGTNAIGISDLLVDGVLYNVDFRFDSAVTVYGNPQIFTFNSLDDAITANEAVNAALNTIDAILTVGPQTSSTYEIAYEADLFAVLNGDAACESCFGPLS